MGTGSLVWPLLRFLLGFAVVLALAALVSRTVALRAGGGGVSPFRWLGGLPLGPGRQICAVRVGRRVLVLGLGDKQVSLLDSITDPEEVEALCAHWDAPKGSGGFRGLLAEAAAKARSRTGGRPLDR